MCKMQESQTARSRANNGFDRLVQNLSSHVKSRDFISYSTLAAMRPRISIPLPQDCNHEGTSLQPESGPFIKFLFCLIPHPFWNFPAFCSITLQLGVQKGQSFLQLHTPLTSARSHRPMPHAPACPPAGHIPLEMASQPSWCDFERIPH